MLFFLFGEFFLFSHIPSNIHLSHGDILPTFEVNLSATFLGYSPSPCSFVSCLLELCPFFLPSFLSFSHFLFLSLSFIMEFVDLLPPGLILGPWPSPTHWVPGDSCALSHSYLRLGSLICWGWLLDECLPMLISWVPWEQLQSSFCYSYIHPQHLTLCPAHNKHSVKYFWIWKWLEVLDNQHVLSSAPQCQGILFAIIFLQFSPMWLLILT